jgi:hypothetical protein
MGHFKSTAAVMDDLDNDLDRDIDDHIDDLESLPFRYLKI